MNKRDAAFVIAFLFWPLLFLCGLTVMKSWPETSRQMLTLLGLSVATFYMGLDIVRAPKTSFFYRVVKRLPLSGHTSETIWLTGLMALVMGLMFGWGFLRLLLNIP
ncbi:MAG TPA: hypothetical protein VMP08_24620 [Anaerolineae bacterium]|nr:hypothetical protein [Anaerolineae bacterium]